MSKVIFYFPSPWNHFLCYFVGLTLESVMLAFANIRFWNCHIFGLYASYHWLIQKRGTFWTGFPTKRYILEWGTSHSIFPMTNSKEANFSKCFPKPKIVKSFYFLEMFSQTKDIFKRGKLNMFLRHNIKSKQVSFLLTLYRPLPPHPFFT